MTLEFRQISPQIEKMGADIAARTGKHGDLLSVARELLHTHATDFGFLHTQITAAEKASEGKRFNWLGAAPADEPLDASFPPPSAPARATVLASDGSQIHPDQHAIALFYLVNVGIIVYRHGSARAPAVNTESQLFYKEDDLFTEQGLLVSGSVVNAKRDVAEVDILARYARAYPTDEPVIALIDGQLTLHMMELSGREQAQYQKDYLGSLDALRDHGATIAAYIDRPRSGFVLSLLHIAALETADITEETIRHNPFIPLTDAQLFRELPPEHRTAIFRQRSKNNADYAKAGHAVHFFYLNTGSTAAPNVVRVEIPEWVATDAERLNTLHALLLKQAAITGGYPYVLARAHELAIIPPAEREALDMQLAIALRKAGVAHAGVSLKQANKKALWG